MTEIIKYRIVLNRHIKLEIVGHFLSSIRY